MFPWLGIHLLECDGDYRVEMLKGIARLAEVGCQILPKPAHCQKLKSESAAILCNGALPMRPELFDLFFVGVGVGFRNDLLQNLLVLLDIAWLEANPITSPALVIVHQV
jgi:hypothetical protein